MTEIIERLKAKSGNARQLSQDLKQAQDYLSVKRCESHQATEAMNIAKSELAKKRNKPPTLHRGKRVKKDSKSLVTESLDTLEEKAKASNEAFKQAKAQVKKIEKILAMKSPSVLIARDAFATDEAVKILSNALSKTELLDDIRQSLTILRVSNPSMKKDELQKRFFDVFFNALLTDETIPTFDNALNAINERLN